MLHATKKPPKTFPFILIILAHSWRGQNRHSFTDPTGHKSRSKMKSKSLLNASNSGSKSAETQVAVWGCLQLYWVFFWGFLSVFVTVIEEKAWVFIRGDAEWLQWVDVWVSQHIQLWHTHAHTRTLRSTEEDKNSNKHSVRLSKRERERRPEWERQQWRDTCRQAGWDMWFPAVN